MLMAELEKRGNDAGLQCLRRELSRVKSQDHKFSSVVSPAQRLLLNKSLFLSPIVWYVVTVIDAHLSSAF